MPTNSKFATESKWSPPEADYTPRHMENILHGVATEDWHCIDCGVNTSPGSHSRVELEEAVKKLGGMWEHNAASVPHTYDERSEVYMVRAAIWAEAGIPDMGGCVCIGCLERRIGRWLKPKDFTDHPFNGLPGTPRLLDRRGG
jgi:hypothetical protein